MDIEGLKEYGFYVQMGYVTLIASLMTLVVTELVKLIFKKKHIIYEGMEASKRDIILSRLGRVVALLMYGIFYIGNELYFKHQINVDGTLLTGLFAGATLTLTLSKGIYTMLHQWSQKKDVFERLEYANNAVEQLKSALSSEAQDHQRTESRKEVKVDMNKTWILTNRKEKEEE